MVVVCRAAAAPVLKCVDRPLPDLRQCLACAWTVHSEFVASPQIVHCLRKHVHVRREYAHLYSCAPDRVRDFIQAFRNREASAGDADYARDEPYLGHL